MDLPGIFLSFSLGVSMIFLRILLGFFSDFPQMFHRASDDLLKALSTYARGIGLAFQIIDDILDLTASSEVLGKTAGKDLSADKTTYPKLLGLEESRQRADALVTEAKDALAPFVANDGAAPLLALADYITSRDR